MNILITICARGGSKGIPGKNVRPLNGVPLIAYTINSAKKYQSLKTDANIHIALSTDSIEIKSVAALHELETNYLRPVQLASDTAGKIETIKDLVLYHEMHNNLKYDYVLDMDITSPLRTVNDIDNAFALLLADPDAYNVYSVSPANRNPYFNMVEKKANGYYYIIKEGEFLSRQLAPEVYDMNSSIYFYHRSFFDTNINKTTTPKSLVYVMPHICFDLDHLVDFEFMEFLIANNKLDFNL